MVVVSGLWEPWNKSEEGQGRRTALHSMFLPSNSLMLLAGGVTMVVSCRGGEERVREGDTTCRDHAGGRRLLCFSSCGIMMMIATSFPMGGRGTEVQCLCWGKSMAFCTAQWLVVVFSLLCALELSIV